MEASVCAPTKFVAVQNKYLASLNSDPIARKNLSLYLNLNFLYSYYLNNSKQYFGGNGEYTSLIVKRQRDLEKFWNMPNQVRVIGQHSSSLNNREILANIFEIYGETSTRAEAYDIADKFLARNRASANLPESPFFSADGFATPDKLIVIGDGLVKMIAETGVAADIVWSGVLAHEWAHQVQFKNYRNWYPEGAATDPAAATRYTELEADFMAAYYLTHKRGATYNWKRVKQFFTLFFQIGDCGFTSSGHHGTPAQRLSAATLGYELAQAAHKQGHIQNQQEVHQYFVSKIRGIL